jgi:hypothetical protein
MNSIALYFFSPRSGWRHKAWGEAQRNPRGMLQKITPAREAADSVYRA